MQLQAVCGAGSDWSLTPTGTDASLRGISAVTDRHVWVSGSKGTVMVTKDGGATWQKRNAGLDPTADFRGIYTADGKTILLMAAGNGDKSALYRSTDAGLHWQTVHRNTIAKAFFDCITFLDPLHGFVLGDPIDGRFFLLETRDGGVHWSPVTTAPAANEGEGAFAASNTSLVVRAPGHLWIGTGGKLGGRVLASHDGGKTWTAAETPLAAHGPETAGVFSLFFVDAQRGYAAGGDYRSPSAATPVLAKTVDGGATWTTIQGPRGYRSAVVATGPAALLVTGPDGSDLQPENAASWQPLSNGFHALSIPRRASSFAASSAAKRVWASGSDGRVAWLPLR